MTETVNPASRNLAGGTMNFIRLIVLTLVIILPCNALAAQASPSAPPTAQVDRVLSSGVPADISSAKKLFRAPLLGWLISEFFVLFLDATAENLSC